MQVPSGLLAVLLILFGRAPELLPRWPPLRLLPSLYLDKERLRGHHLGDRSGSSHLDFYLRYYRGDDWPSWPAAADRVSGPGRPSGGDATPISVRQSSIKTSWWQPKGPFRTLPDLGTARNVGDILIIEIKATMCMARGS